MNAQEISKLIEDEISNLRKSDRLKEKLRIGDHQLDENYMVKKLVSPHLEYYSGALGSKLWMVWEEEYENPTSQRYVIIYDEEYKAFTIALKPDYIHISQYKDSFVDCFVAL